MSNSTRTAMMFIVVFIFNSLLMAVGNYEKSNNEVILAKSKITSGRNENASLIGKYSKAAFNAIDAVGNTLYYGAGEFFGVMDISNPDDLTDIGKLNLSSEILDIKVQGNYAYVVSWFSGFYIIDISDSTLPQIVYYNTEYASNNYGINVHGNYLYIYSISGLRVFNIEDIDNVEYVYNLPFGITEVCFSNNYMFTAAVGSGLNLGVYDLSNPENPELVTTFYDNGMAFVASMVIDDDKLYYVKPGESFGIVDVSNINDIQLINQYANTVSGFPSYYWDIDIQGDYAFLANASYSSESNSTLIFDVVNISEPDAISIEYSFTNLIGADNVMYKVRVVGNYAY